MRGKRSQSNFWKTGAWCFTSAKCVCFQIFAKYNGVWNLSLILTRLFVSLFQLFAYVAFAISVIWIYTTANEIVNLLRVQLLKYFSILKLLFIVSLSYANLHCPTVTRTGDTVSHRVEKKWSNWLKKAYWRCFYHLILQTFGIALSLSDAILGLTFLAWGNSLGGEYRLSQAVSHTRSAIPLFF